MEYLKSKIVSMRIISLRDPTPDSDSVFDMSYPILITNLQRLSRVTGVGFKFHSGWH